MFESIKTTLKHVFQTIYYNLLIFIVLYIMEIDGNWPTLAL